MLSVRFDSAVFACTVQVLFEKLVFTYLFIHIDQISKWSFTMKTKTIALALLLSIFGVTGCSESKEDTKQEVMSEMEEAGEATAETYEDAKEEAADSWDDAKDSAEEAYEDGKGMASDAYEEGKEKASDAYEEGKEMGADMMEEGAAKTKELKDATAKKLREACIKMKEKMGGDVSECDTKD